jgi:hypothetical protein
MTTFPTELDGSHDRPDATEADRMRRHLRALSAVNRQLQAQLESGARLEGAGRGDDSGEPGVWSTLAIRRGSSGSGWLEQLQLQGGGDPYLVRGASKGVFLVEGVLRRQIKSGLIFGALARMLGEPKLVKDSEIERWHEGPPVEVMEGGTGPAFIVVGGRRLPLRGIPLPHLVSTEEMLMFPEGEELNIAAVPAPSFGSRLSRVRKLAKREGVLRAGLTVTKRGLRRFVPKRSPKAKPKSS